MNSPEQKIDLSLDQTLNWQGIELQYPGFWEVETVEEEGNQSITITTENTSFWMLTLIPEPLSAEEVLETALESFHEEYEEIDVYEQTWDEQRTWVTQELDLVYHELISSVVLQVMALENAVLFVMYQGQDKELDQSRQVFQAITSSIKLDRNLFS